MLNLEITSFPVVKIMEATSAMVFDPGPGGAVEPHSLAILRCTDWLSPERRFGPLF
jgi:hypothetical protein